MPDHTQRHATTCRSATKVGKMTLGCFSQPDHLTVDVIGHQDFVSEADRNVEQAVRAALADTGQQRIDLGDRPD